MKNDKPQFNWQALNEELPGGIDFDNTLVNVSVRVVEDHKIYIPLEPKPGAVEAAQKIKETGRKVVIYTARHWSDKKNIEDYCRYYGIYFDEVICGKPLFHYLIDDRAINFNGNWEESLEQALKL